MGKDDKPGLKGKIVEEPKLSVGNKVKIRQHEGLSVSVPDNLKPEVVYTVAKVEPIQFRSCTLDESDCKRICKHFEECQKEFDEVYADLIVQQLVTLQEVPDTSFGSCWFDKV